MKRSAALLAGLLAAPLALAQAHVPDTAFGVVVAGDAVHAMGPTFGAHFTSGGVEFTPVLGDRAEHPATVRFTWTDASRSGEPIARRDGAAVAAAAGNRVSYTHGTNLTELYEVRRDGIEQSFVFATRPEGTGDLVVRGEITTALPLGRADARGVRFEMPNGAGVSFGAVTGVDANGRTAPGSLRLAGTTLELALPAAFVDNAAYPLVLDPLIGAVIPIGDVAAEPDRRPSVAFDEGTNRYLVTWNVQYAAAAWEVRGQIVSGGGVVQGAPFTISAPGVSTAIDRCAVANVRGVGRFVVAMRGIGATNSLLVRSVSAANASMAAIATLVASPARDVRMASIGGDSRPAGANALVAFRDFNVSNGFTYGYTTLLSVAANGTISTVLADNERTNNPNPGIEITVARHGGPLGRWLTAWTATTGSGALRKVDAQIVGPAGTSCSPVINVAQTNSGAETVSELACASLDGVLGIVTWTYNSGSTRSVRAKVLTVLGACGTVTAQQQNEVILPAGTSLRDRPAVDYAADKWILAFRERVAVGGQARVVVLGLDRDQGTPAGAEHFPEGYQPVDSDPAIGAKWSGGSTSDEVLVAWSDDAAIRGHRFEATGTGTITALGGACGLTGLNNLATYSGTPALGTTFTIDLHTPTDPILALIVGFTQTPFACGPCTIVPSPDVLLPGANPTVVAIPTVPSLIGAELFTQWLQWRPSGCPVLPDFGFSNTLKFTIAE